MTTDTDDATKPLATVLLEFADELDTVKHLVTATFNAGRYGFGNIPDDGRPFDVAAMVADERLSKAVEKFREIRHRIEDETARLPRLSVVR